MLVVLALAAVAVIAGVIAVAMGRGGEMAESVPDVPPLDLPQAGHFGAVDLMTLRLPVSLVGYHTQTVDETLNRVASALSERDTRIAVLEQRVSELLASRLQARQEPYGDLPGASRAEHERWKPAGEDGPSSELRREMPGADGGADEPTGPREVRGDARGGPLTEHEPAAPDDSAELREVAGAEGPGLAEEPSGETAGPSDDPRGPGEAPEPSGGTGGPGETVSETSETSAAASSEAPAGGKGDTDEAGASTIVGGRAGVRKP
ncbi:hypothetical protein [Streptosporangium fragile]|uniref:hypothetical protein n=1 Tax=Streptosporangium fragile TaxID=46186 RepID=UPI0031EEAF41